MSSNLFTFGQPWPMPIVTFFWLTPVGKSTFAVTPTWSQLPVADDWNVEKYGVPPATFP